MKPTTEELKALLAKVTPGEWIARTYPDAIGQVTAIKIWAGSEFSGPQIAGIAAADCTRNLTEDCSNSKILCLAPSLAREVIELREALNDLLTYCVTEKGFPNKDHRTVEQQFAYDKARKLLS